MLTIYKRWYIILALEKWDFAIIMPKRNVHNISVVHIDGGEGGIRTPVTPADSLSRGCKCSYFAEKNDSAYVVGM